MDPLYLKHANQNVVPDYRVGVVSLAVYIEHKYTLIDRNATDVR